MTLHNDPNRFIPDEHIWPNWHDVIRVMDRSHGSPSDRGSADAYYGRPYSPHKFGENFTAVNLTSAREIADYRMAYFGEYDRKDWGGE